MYDPQRHQECQDFDVALVEGVNAEYHYNFELDVSVVESRSSGNAHSQTWVHADYETRLGVREGKGLNLLAMSAIDDDASKGAKCAHLPRRSGMSSWSRY